MLPLSRPKEKKNGKYDPGMDVKENESPGDETGANAEEAEDPEAGDGAFVSTNGHRKRRSAHAKLVPCALVLAFWATAIAAGVGVSVKRARITPATAGAVEQLAYVPSGPTAAEGEGVSKTVRPLSPALELNGHPMHLTFLVCFNEGGDSVSRAHD